MNWGRMGVPPPGRPTPTDIAPTPVDARRCAHQARFQSLACGGVRPGQANIEPLASTMHTAQHTGSAAETQGIVSFVQALVSSRPQALGEWLAARYGTGGVRVRVRHTFDAMRGRL